MNYFFIFIFYKLLSKLRITAKRRNVIKKSDFFASFEIRKGLFLCVKLYERYGPSENLCGSWKVLVAIPMRDLPGVNARVQYTVGHIYIYSKQPNEGVRSSPSSLNAGNPPLILLSHTYYDYFRCKICAPVDRSNVQTRFDEH